MLVEVTAKDLKIGDVVRVYHGRLVEYEVTARSHFAGYERYLLVDTALPPGEVRRFHGEAKPGTIFIVERAMA